MNQYKVDRRLHTSDKLSPIKSKNVGKNVCLLTIYLLEGQFHLILSGTIAGYINRSFRMTNVIFKAETSNKILKTFLMLLRF